ncbi:MAG: type II toxin-antitoxin system HicB family antitoxin [Armatimonadetes bacterium]|nr:type II toxin-antitoxin system HicB family antitoxin [Armatimonadota bacterium]
MQPRKYRVDIYWSEEDECYLAEVPDLPGCVTHGETVSEAARNAEEAMECWLEAAEEAGDPIPLPSTVKQWSGRFLARIPRDLHADLALEAQRQGVSLNQYVVAQLAAASAVTRARRAPRRTRPAAGQARASRKPAKAT